MSKRSMVKLAVRTAAGVCAAALAFGSAAQDTKIVLGMSGWTGFAPLTLADKARKDVLLDKADLFYKKIADQPGDEDERLVLAAQIASARLAVSYSSRTVHSFTSDNCPSAVRAT